MSQKRATAKPGTKPSPRELEVLRYVASGYTNKAIAISLGIGYYTVCDHLVACYRCLEVHNRTMAVMEAKRLGLI